MNMSEKYEPNPPSDENVAKRHDIIFQKSDFEISADEGKTACMKADDVQGERTFHEEIEIKYFYEGSATLMIGEEVIVAKAGDITVANPYEIHSTIRVGDPPAKYHLFMVGMDFFAQGCTDIDLRQTLITGGICFNNLIRGSQRLQAILLRTLEELRETKPFYRQAVQGMMAEFFALLLRNEVSREKRSGLEDSRIKYTRVIVPALLRMQRGYAVNITVDELAALCGVSKFHFCRIFREATGMTAMQYLTHCRLKMADILLSSTDKKIAEIAWECGFEDESYFGRCYKKCKGYSPKEGRIAANRAILSEESSIASIAPPAASKV